MSERQRKWDTYHWVIGAEGEDPMIALWGGRLFRVGIGGGLNKPPTRWVPDTKAEPRRRPEQAADAVGAGHQG